MQVGKGGWNFFLPFGHGAFSYSDFINDFFKFQSLTSSPRSPIFSFHQSRVLLYFTFKLESLVTKLRIVSVFMLLKSHYSSENTDRKEPKGKSRFRKGKRWNVTESDSRKRNEQSSISVLYPPYSQPRAAVHDNPLIFSPYDTIHDEQKTEGIH